MRVFKFSLSVVSILEILFIFSRAIQDSPRSHSITAEHEVANQKTLTPGRNIILQPAVTDIMVISNDSVPIIPRNNISKSHRRRKNRKTEVRQRGTTPTIQISQLQSNEESTETTTKLIIKKRRRKGRKRRKNRKKHKLDNSSILEVTTAKGIIFPANADSNTTINEIIEMLNKNPEETFDDFKITHSNQSSILFSDGQNMARLVAPVLPNSLNNTVTLHFNIDNGVKQKHYGTKYNRCSINRGGCAHLCSPKGKTNCSCLAGFTLDTDRRTCLDIDECKVNNGGCEISCDNILGSYNCHCSTGLRLADDLKSCEDVNECLLRNGHGPCQDICKNTFGSYKCSCGINGTKLALDGHNCDDLDECVNNNAGCSHFCINALGRSYCSCPSGMELSSDWKTCQDINECENDDVKKICGNGCVNTAGSYLCLDDSDMQNDQYYTNIACKPLFPPAVGFISCSREGAYQSYTKNGRKRTINSPGTVCRLICPTGYKLTEEYRLTCGLDGTWQGNGSAKCIRHVQYLGNDWFFPKNRQSRNITHKIIF